MDNKYQVALVPCPSYAPELLDKAVREGLALLGDMEEYVGKDESILLKPNLLRNATPEQAITTHPAVFSAVARHLQTEGYTKLSYADSPGFLGPGNNTQKVTETSGFATVAAELGIPLGKVNSAGKVAFSDGREAKRFHIIDAVLEADAIISIAKMKTHALLRITGAVKNSYGYIYALHKAQGHAQWTDAETFGRMLVDLNRFKTARLFIMDGIVAMEGNGPSSGNPVAMNMLLFAKNPLALDSVFCALIGLDPELVHTNRWGEIDKLGSWHWDTIEVLTPEATLTVEEAAAKYGKADFDVNREKKKKKNKRWQQWTGKRPVIIKNNCRICGLCVSSCPLDPPALKIVNKQPPVYDYQRCIRCYCCQEMCPHRAIEVKTPCLGTILPR